MSHKISVVRIASYILCSELGFGKIRKFGKISNDCNFKNKKDAVTLRPFLGSLWSYCIYRGYRKSTEYVFEPFNYPFLRVCLFQNLQKYIFGSHLLSSIFVYFNAFF